MNYLKYARPVRDVVVGGSGEFPTVTYNSIQEAINAAQPGDHISIYPGVYAEALVIPDTKRDLVFVGAGALDEITVVGDGTGSIPLEVNGAKGLTFINIGLECDGTAPASLYLHEEVRRVSFYNCKVEGSDTTNIQIAHTAADAESPADVLFEDCDITWGGTGVMFGTSSDGVPTQIYFRRTLFHNHSDTWVALSAGGGFYDVEMENCRFLLGEDHTVPTLGIDVATAYGVLTGGYIQLASDAMGLGTHTNMPFIGTAFTDGVIPVP